MEIQRKHRRRPSQTLSAAAGDFGGVWPQPQTDPGSGQETDQAFLFLFFKTQRPSGQTTLPQKTTFNQVEQF